VLFVGELLACGSCLQSTKSTLLAGLSRLGMSSISPVERAMVWITPRSTPTGGPMSLGATTTDCPILKQMCYPTGSLIKRAPVIRPGQTREVPGSERVQWNRTRPIRGMVTSPQ
jgi:hypothetical protein